MKSPAQAEQLKYPLKQIRTKETHLRNIFHSFIEISFAVLSVCEYALLYSYMYLFACYMHEMLQR